MSERWELWESLCKSPKYCHRLQPVINEKTGRVELHHRKVEGSPKVAKWLIRRREGKNFLRWGEYQAHLMLSDSELRTLAKAIDDHLKAEAEATEKMLRGGADD